jgi:hypothetical protein
VQRSQHSQNSRNNQKQAHPMVFYELLSFSDEDQHPQLEMKNKIVENL